MTLIATINGTSKHTGSVCGSSVEGTLQVGSNNFVTIEGKLVMVSDGIMEIPTHANPPCATPVIEGHSYSPDTLQNNHFFIEGKPIVVVGDFYSSDATEVDSAGQNFVNVI